MTGTTGAIPGAVASAPIKPGLLTAGQSTFAAELSKQTGLDPRVIGAWLLSEESSGAAASRQAAGNHDWLNIGYTDSKTYGAADSIWSDPVTAADATAGWLKGQNTIPGYGTASKGIQGILSTASAAPASQIYALQHSGWASSGYPSLPSLYAQVAGDPGFSVPSVIAGPAGDVAGAVGGAASGVVGAVTGTASLVSAVLNPKTWLRVAMAVGAFLLLAFGLFELAGGHGDQVTRRIPRPRKV